MEATNLLDRTGSLGVVVLVQHVTRGSRGVDDNEFGTSLDHVLLSLRAPSGASEHDVGKGQVGIEQARVWASEAVPGPSKVLGAIRFGVLLVEVQDAAGLGGLPAEKRGARRQSDTDGIHQEALSGAWFPGEGNQGSPGDKVTNEPIDGRLDTGEEFRNGEQRQGHA